MLSFIAALFFLFASAILASALLGALVPGFYKE